MTGRLDGTLGGAVGIARRAPGSGPPPPNWSASPPISDIKESTLRVALTRMVAAGDLGAL